MLVSNGHVGRRPTSHRCSAKCCSGEVTLGGEPFDRRELERLLAALASDHDDLGVRLRTLSHTAKSKDENVCVHAHYFAFREGKPTVQEFVELLTTKLVSFCMSRKHINEAYADWKDLSPSKQIEGAIGLRNRAFDLFKRAQKKTNRNGEFGEVIAFLLMEYVLKAPQLVAKMSLKTNREMPVHGSDGIHFKFDDASGSLTLLWGESKCYASLTDALSKAVASVFENLQDNKMSHELFLVKEHGDLSFFSKEAQDAILSFLDPYNENYNKRVDGSVILIAFDFDRFAELKGLKLVEVEPRFQDLLRAELDACVTRLDERLKDVGIERHALNVFFLPVPSVADIRSSFQDKIGWAA